MQARVAPASLRGETVQQANVQRGCDQEFTAAKGGLSDHQYLTLQGKRFINRQLSAFEKMWLGPCSRRSP